MRHRGLRGLLVATLVGVVGGCGGSASAVLTQVRDASPDECPAGGVVVVQGTDNDGDGELAGDEIVSRSPVCDGEDGAPALIRATDEPPGSECAAGGVRIDVGTDGDGDGVLDDEEIDSTEFLCEAVATLVATVGEGPSKECPAGGVRIDSGPDLDGDHVLDEAEVSSSELACHGADGDSVAIRVDSIDPGDDGCESGGRWIHVGVDADGNGVLGDAEIAQSSRLCDAGYAVLVATDPEPAGQDCPAGGVQLHDGFDLDGDGLLDEDEIEHTTLLCHGAEASLVTFIATLRDPMPLANHMFGGAVALSGNTLVVRRAGVIDLIVYERTAADSPWVQVATLTGTGLSAEVGRALEFAGPSIVAGAPHDNQAGAGRGAIYTFDTDGGSWTQTQKLLSPEPGDVAFGSIFAVDGNRLIVGSGSAPRKVYVYERSAPALPWVLSSTVSTPNGTGFLALSGDVFALGHFNEVAIYDRVPASGAWSNSQMLSSNFAQFTPYSISMQGDLLVVGAPTLDLPGPDVGAAVVFQRPLGSAWTQVGALRVPTASAAGFMTRILDERIVFTAETNQFGGGTSLFVAEHDEIAGWNPIQQLASPDRLDDRFGWAMASSGSELWVGAAQYSTQMFAATGAVHGFAVR